MKLRRKFYYTLLAALLAGGIAFHKTAVLFIENLPSIFDVNLYVLLLGIVYFLITAGMVEYFILYRLVHIEKTLSQTKLSEYEDNEKIFDSCSDDEIGKIAERINEMLEKYRKKNAQVRKKDEMYASVVNDAPVLVCRFLPDGTITFANRSYADVYGKDRKELVGKNIFHLIEESGHETKSLKRSLGFLRPENQTDICFYEVPSRESPYSAWIMWVNRAFLDKYGSVIEYQSIGIDLYAQTSNGISNMMNNLLNLVYFVNKDGRLKYASLSNKEVLGFHPSDMIGKDIFEFFHDDNHEFLKEQLNKRFNEQNKETAIKELKIKNSNDQYTWIKAAIDSIVASNGSVSDIAINAKEIMELKNIEDKLNYTFNNVKKVLDRIDTLEFIIDKSPVITLVWKDGKTLDYVSANIKQLGYEKKELLSGTIDFVELIHPDERKIVMEHMNVDTDDHKEVETIKYRIKDKAGNYRFVKDKTFVVKEDNNSLTYYKNIEIIN